MDANPDAYEHPRLKYTSANVSFERAMERYRAALEVSALTHVDVWSRSPTRSGAEAQRRPGCRAHNALPAG